MNRSLLLILILILSSGYEVLGQSGMLKGKVVDHYTNEPIPFASIAIIRDSNNIFTTTSDHDGNYKVNLIPAGIVSVKSTYVGYTTVIINDVVIGENQIRFLDIKLKPSSEMLNEVEILDYVVPLIDKDMTASGATIPDYAVRGMNSYINSIHDKDITREGDFYQSSQLTATELNDFSKWNLWQDIQKNDLREFQKLWGISPMTRYSVQVLSKNNMPVVDAEVFLESSDKFILWKARTDNTGKAELWLGMFDSIKIKKLKLVVVYGGESYDYKKPNVFKRGINVLKLPVECNNPNNIDIAFVVDATGSMGDEIEFLKTDLVDIIHNTTDKFGETSISLGSVFYRCFGDSYVTKMSQLSSDIKKTIDFISYQNAGEGGDEVVEEAFEIAVDSLNWNQSARARLLFFVLDEQPLTNPDVVNKMQVYTQKAAEKGIRVIPIIASAETFSHAESLEYLMRSIALATNGTSIFLTDHSNIGNVHAKPTTDQYDVELLNNLLKRIIYQFCYVPSCNEKIDTEGISDTTYITNSPIIAHEIIDTSRKIKETTPKTRLVDYSVSEENDTIYNGDGENEDVGEKVDDTVDTKEIKNVSIKLYPNPTSGKITVNVSGSISELFLFDISGKLISKYSVSNKSSLIIDLSNYGTGIYFLKFYDNLRWYSGKIILSH